MRRSASWARGPLIRGSLYVNTTTKKIHPGVFRVASHEKTRPFQWLAGRILEATKKTSEIVDLFDNANPGRYFFLGALAPSRVSCPSNLPRVRGLWRNGTIFFTKQLEIGTGRCGYSRPKAGLRKKNRERLASRPGSDCGLDAGARPVAHPS